MARSTRTIDDPAEARSVVFLGPPRKLVAVGDLPDFTAVPEIGGELKAHLLPGEQALHFRPAGRRGAARVHLRLAATTPPGEYAGELVTGKESRKVLVRVLEDTRVSVLAGELDFTGALDSRATATLAIANDGNTEIELPRVIAIGLFEDSGLETAFAASYDRPVKGIDDFVEVFHGKLREAHSGVQKLAVTKGAGRHGPGTSFLAEFAMDLKKPLRAGHRYHGVVSTDFGEFSVSVSVTHGAPR